MKLVCKKCGEESRKVILPKYEYKKGIILECVEVYECANCSEFVFIEKQMEEVERRVGNINII